MDTGAFVAGTTIGVVAAIGLVMFIERDGPKKRSSGRSRATTKRITNSRPRTALYRAPKQKASKPGYYVLLYNYPAGNRDRRMKGFNGPFGSKSKAEMDAQMEQGNWYTSVRKLSDDPIALGM
jgi:hypothetical protein